MALICLGLGAITGTSAARADTAPAPIPTCTSSIPNCTPPQLLNDAELSAPYALDPTDFYAATAAQVASLHTFEQQAIADTLADHDLPASDTAAVQSWGRADALSELWGLVAQAIQATNRTTDQQNVVDWLTTVMHRRAQAEADDAGWEFLKWAGAVSGTAAEPTQATVVSDLNSFASGASQPTQYNTGSDQNATSGFCEWQPPAPFQSDYTGDVFTPAGSSTADTWCFPPSYQCTTVLGCNNNEPSYDQFVKYGDGDVENLRGDNTDSAVLTTQVARALEFAGASVGAGLTGLALAATLGPVLTSSALTSALFPWTATALLDFGAATEALAPEVAGGMAATAIGSAVTIVVLAVAIAVIQGIQVAANANLPGQLSSLITNAAAGTPDLQSMLGDSQQLTGLLGVFVDAALPNPSLQACDNSSIAISGAGITPAPCLDAPPIPAPAPGDPQFLITPKGSAQSTRSDTISWTDIVEQPYGQGALSTYTQDSARISGTWFVTHVTDARQDNSVPPVTTAPDWQSLSMHYFNWDGYEETAWLVKQPDGSFKFLTALGPGGGTGVQTPIDPTTCLAQKLCGYSDSIDYIRFSSLTQSPVTVSYASASVVPASPPTIPVYAGGAATEGSPITLFTNVPGGPYTYQWYLEKSGQHSTCIPAGRFCGSYDGPYAGSTLPSGSQVTYTWQAGGTFNGVLLVTDGGGRTYEKDFTVTVGDVAPTLTLGTSDVHTVDFGKPSVFTGVLTHAGADDTENLTVHWGDGSTDTFSGGGGNPYGGSDGMDLTNTGTEIDFTATHQYADSGSYAVTVTDSDGDGGSASQSTTETVNPITSSVTMQVSPATPVVGQPITDTAVVSAGSVRPTGNVVFLTVTGTGVLPVCGPVQLSASAPYTATCTLSYGSAGSYQVFASYVGDTNTTSATSPLQTVTVAKSGTGTGLSASTSAPVVGQQVTYTAAVAAAAPGNATPTGTVTFTDGSTVLCSDVALSSSAPYTATCTQTYQAPGAHAVSATYSGDDFTTASTSSAVTVTVSKAATTTVYSPPATTPPQFGTPTSFTVTVGGAGSSTGGPVATGTTTYTVDGLQVGKPVTLAGGAATSVAVPGLTPGTHTVVAHYSGDGNYTASTVKFTVTVGCGTTYRAGQRVPSTIKTSVCVDGGSIRGHITIGKGGSLALIDASVHGTITARTGSTLAALGSTIYGTTAVSGADAVTVCGTTVHGALRITDSTGLVLLGSGQPSCGADNVRGSVALQGNKAGVVIDGATVHGAVAIDLNRGSTLYPALAATEVSANQIYGALACARNTPPPVDGGHANTVRGSVGGQCAALTQRPSR